MADDQPDVMEVDLTQEAVEEAAPAPVQLSPLPLNLLSTIKTAQAENGLRHGDYMRYRKHCASRLQSLYKVLKMQHGRTKYQKRKLDVHNVTDVRHLYVTLFSAERAWAYAMELKREAEARGEAGRVDPRKRHHLIGRLAKAVQWSSELVRLAAARSDTRGSLEAEAYCAWLGGCLLLERESDWEVALAKFSRAKKLWQELAKACGELEGQSLCLAQVEEMEPNIRYCTYRISRAGGAVPADPQELLALAEAGGAAGGGAGLELLQSKLAALAAEAQLAASASASSLEWLGVRHPVRHERVKLALHQAAEYTQQAEQMMNEGDTAAAAAGGAGAGSSDALDARLALYDKAINALAEARSHVRNAAKGLSGPDAESHYRELEGLEGAVEGQRLVRAVERTQLLLAHTAGRFAAGLQRLALGKKIKDKERHARPEEVLRLLDQLGRQLEELGELGARMGGRQGEALHEAAAARAAAARAQRTYHVAHVLLAALAPASTPSAPATNPSDPASSSTSSASAAHSTRALEAWALLHRAQERAAAAAEQLQALPAAGAGGGGGSAEEAGVAAVLGGGVREVLVREMRELGGLAEAYKAVAQAELSAADQRAREELQAGVGALSLQPTDTQQPPQPPSQQTQYLLDALDRWESFAGGAAAAAAAGGSGTAGAKAPPRLYKAPYGFGAIPIRPIMLDTASNCLSYPSLEHRVRKAEKKSVLSSLFGWRR